LKAVRLRVQSNYVSNYIGIHAEYGEKTMKCDSIAVLKLLVVQNGGYKNGQI